MKSRRTGARAAGFCLTAVLLLAGHAGPAQETAGNNRLVNFNYDQVEIRILARNVGMSTGRKFVVDEAVKDKVTVVTTEDVPVEEVYDLFVSVLESVGYSVVEEGGISRVVPLPESPTRVARVLGPDDPVDGVGIVTKVMKLEHISVLEVARAIEPLVRGAKEGAISTVASANRLIITDTSESIRRVEQIVDELDQPGASSSVAVVHLDHASARDVADQVAVAMRGTRSSGEAVSGHLRTVTGGGAALPANFSAVASEEMNSLILVGSPMQLAEAQRIIGELDVERSADSGRLNAIFLNYIDAEEAAKNLNDLLADSVEESRRRRIAIQANIETQALIVDASPHDFAFVEQLVSALDQKPRQVLVEILIAEVSVGKELDLGVELSTTEQPEAGSTTVIGRSRPGETDVIMDLVTEQIFPQGLSFGVARGTIPLADGTSVPAISVLLTALAQDRDVNIVSRPSLLAEDNKEATVSVVDNIPILTSVVDSGAGTARDITQNIERQDVGVKLSLTPHINQQNEIQLELNPAIEAIVDEGDPELPFTPTIARREVKTTVTVEDGQTAVISGLIQEDMIKTVSKVPFLGDMPFLRVLFRRTIERKQRTNLLVFVTPHLVQDAEHADQLRRELEARTGMDAVLTNHVQGVESAEP